MVDELSQMKEGRIMMKKTGTVGIVATNTGIRKGTRLKGEKVQEKEVMKSLPEGCTCRKEETVVTTGRKGMAEEKAKVRIGETGTVRRQAKEVYRHVIVGKATARHLD